ncbi:putative ankyrin [Trypanosoma vivax]|uniref:Putative ankyrin n=1 Tax=Trypanosoma vivax (strain Y486) TaxID=1055687 RepID=G0TTZ2_TRYVY|nr:putative ankyrin [Trypanosoma vivax]CCC47425.1 putative ankyrin [Trypanosoma vivax Y486]
MKQWTLEVIDRQDREEIRRVFSGGNVNELSADGYTPLYYACMKKSVRIETIKELLELGADVNLKGVDRETPLYIACFNGREDVAMLLLENGAERNVKNGRLSEAALHVAARTGNCALLELITVRGTDLNVQNIRQETPLFVAAKAGFHDAVHQLLKVGANPNICDIDGKSPLYIASEKNFKHIVILLKSERKDLTIAKVMADEALRSRAPPFKTTEELQNGQSTRGSLRSFLRDSSELEKLNKLKPIDIIEINIPCPRGGIGNPFHFSTVGPCLSLEDVGYDGPPQIPPSLQNRSPIKRQRIGGTTMRVGTSIDSMGVEPIRVDTTPGEMMQYSPKYS